MKLKGKKRKNLKCKVEEQMNKWTNKQEMCVERETERKTEREKLRERNYYYDGFGLLGYLRWKSSTASLAWTTSSRLTQSNSSGVSSYPSQRTLYWNTVLHPICLILESTISSTSILAHHWPQSEVEEVECIQGWYFLGRVQVERCGMLGEHSWRLEGVGCSRIEDRLCWLLRKGWGFVLQASSKGKSS